MPVSLEKLEPYVIPERRARYARVSIWLRTHAVLASLMVLFCSASLRLVMISRADMNQLVADYSDAGTYFIPAQNLIDQREFLNNKGKPMITRTPGYPVFLAGIMLLVGRDMRTVLIVQTIILSCRSAHSILGCAPGFTTCDGSRRGVDSRFFSVGSRARGGPDVGWIYFYFF